MRLLSIVKKDLKLLVRTRSSALILILAPLLIILLMGLAFDNTNTYGLNVGTYSANYGSVSGVINKLQDQSFKVVKYKEEYSCKEGVRLGDVHVCVSFPPDFSPNKQNDVKFYVDYSKSNLVYMIIDSLSSKVDLQAKEISQGFAKTLFDKIENSRKILDDKKALLLDSITKVDNAKGKVDLSKISISSMDISFDKSIDVYDAKGDIDSFKSYALSAVNTSKAKLASAKSSVDNLNASSSEKSEINGLIDDADSELDSIKNKIEKEGNASIESALNKLVILNNKITNLGNKLGSASASKDKAGSDLGDSSKTLDEAKSSLDQLELDITSVIGDLSSLPVKNAEILSNPISIDIVPIRAPTTYLNYLFPSLIALIIMFVSLLLSTTIVMAEKHSPAYIRNYLAPTRALTFVFGSFVSNFVIILTQLIIILAVGIGFFSNEMMTSLHLTLLNLLVISSVFITIGMAVGYLYTSEETGILASVSLGSVFMILSGLIIPLESTPHIAQVIIGWTNPFVISERLLRDSIIFNHPISIFWKDILLMLGYALLFFILSLLLHKSYFGHAYRKFAHIREGVVRKEKIRKENVHIGNKSMKKSEEKIGVKSNVKKIEKPKIEKKVTEEKVIEKPTEERVIGRKRTAAKRVVEKTPVRRSKNRDLDEKLSDIKKELDNL